MKTFPTDTFTGNGSATAYTLSETPTSASSVMVFVDGILQKSSTNYGISGATLTFTSAPANSAEIEVKHLGFRGVQRRSTGYVLDTFTGNGSATAFTLSNAVQSMMHLCFTMVFVCNQQRTTELVVSL